MRRSGFEIDPSAPDWVHREMPNVPTFLARVRARPGLYFRSPSVRGLWTLLFGIGLAEDFHGIPAVDRFGGFDFELFEAWVGRTYNVERLSVDSFGLAEELTGSDAAGFARWFDWYDQFNADANRR